MRKEDILSTMCIEEMDRRSIKEAVYNPRSMSRSARAGLRESIKKNGLVEPPIWNRRTGNLVGGHQRLSVLDEIMGSKDYRIPVAIIDVDAKKEKEINVALNNPSIQGTYDFVLLQKIIDDVPGFDAVAAGFTAADFAVFSSPVEVPTNKPEEKPAVNMARQNAVASIASNHVRDTVSIMFGVQLEQNEAQLFFDMLGVPPCSGMTFDEFRNCWNRR
jgi:hypothetical protein